MLVLHGSLSCKQKGFQSVVEKLGFQRQAHVCSQQVDVINVIVVEVAE